MRPEKNSWEGELETIGFLFWFCKALEEAMNGKRKTDGF